VTSETSEVDGLEGRGGVARAGTMATPAREYQLRDPVQGAGV